MIFGTKLSWENDIFVFSKKLHKLLLASCLTPRLRLSFLIVLNDSGKNWEENAFLYFQKLPSWPWSSYKFMVSATGSVLVMAIGILQTWSRSLSWAFYMVIVMVILHGHGHGHPTWSRSWTWFWSWLCYLVTWSRFWFW